MTVLLAVTVVGAGSLLLRLVPLLGSRRMPERLAEVAGWAGLAVIATMSVRAVLAIEDPAVPGAPLVAAMATTVGLLLALRGRSVLVAVAVGLSTYVVTGAALQLVT